MAPIKRKPGTSAEPAAVRPRGQLPGTTIYTRPRGASPGPAAPLTISSGAGSPGSVFGFSESLLTLTQEALRELVDVSRARCALVIDRTGCILASAGDFHPINPSTMGAIAAATIAALNSMVSRASSPEVSVKFYGGDVDKIHFVLIEDRLALCLLHSRQATSGQIRAAARAFLQ